MTQEKQDNNRKTQQFIPVLSSVLYNPTKRTAKGILLVMVFFLMLFPFINSLNQFLVNVIEPLIYFKPLQDVIIPYEVRIVRVILDFVGIPMTGGSPGVSSITLITKGGGHSPIVVAWNCLGWQSLLVVGATFISGLTGKFTLASKLEVLVVGLLGTFLLNIGRLSLVFVLFYNFSGGVAQAFHDYGSVILTIGWLFGLWYYAFHFVLTPKDAGSDAD